MDRLVRKKKDFESIAKTGLAVEYFPHYVNLKPQMHSVDVVLMSVIFRGRGFHHMNNAVFEESGASVAITNYDEAHSIVTDSNGMEVMNIYLDTERFDFSGLQHDVMNAAAAFIPVHNSFKNSLNRLLRIEFGDMEKLRLPLFAVAREFKEKEMACDETACGYFKIFLTECARQIMKSGLLRPALHALNPAIEKLKKFLDVNYSQELSLEAIAKKIGYSKNHLCRLFKSYTGKTIYEYILQCRIRHAAWKLRNADEKIFSVAFESGFNDISYFNRVFRKFIGTSPGKYRRTSSRDA